MYLSFFFPKETTLSAYIKQQQGLDFTYSDVGASGFKTPKGFDSDHTFIKVGQGDLAFQKAKKVLENWQQFPVSWTRIYAKKTPPVKEQTVAVLFKIFGLWWLNSSRIVYTFDEPDRFGYAYGTLPGHVEKGEEVFWVARNEKGEIFYHIKAFSKPAYWFVSLAYPLARFFQKRFVRNSMQQMKKLVSKDEK